MTTEKSYRRFPQLFLYSRPHKAIALVNFSFNTTREITEVFYKFEDIVECALQVLQEIRETHDLCLEGWGPSAVLGNIDVKDAYVRIHERGGKIRLITEITSANIADCKEFMKFSEVRHLDKVKGNFSVSDKKWYTASSTSEKDKPPPRLIYSTVKEIALQHQYFFETLWDKATPAGQRIAEIEGGPVTEKTEIVHGEANTINLLARVMASVKKEAIACSGSIVPMFCMTVEPAKKVVVDAALRGVKSRQITEITKDNLAYCKEFMKYVELRHMSNIQGNMMVADNAEYVATASINPTSVPKAIYSNAAPIVEQQKLFFENLWSRAIPAQQRIRELEEGIEPEFVEVITDGAKAANLIVDFAKSVRKEAQLILPQPQTMERAGKLGMWDFLIGAANNGAEIRVICPLTELNLDLARQIMSKAPHIRILSGPATTAGLFIQDENRYLRAEDGDPNAAEAADAISTVIYSNSYNGVISFKSFFETLWRQSELYEQLTVANEKLVLHDKMQQEFVNIAAHELRTPIQPILGIANLFETQLEGKERIEVTKEDVSMIIRNAARLERLSSDILTVSRIESQSLQIRKEPINLQDKIRNVIADVRSYIKPGQELEIVFEPPSEPIVVEADRTKLFEVLFNLLRNAIKFTPCGTITITLQRQKLPGNSEHALVAISDTGTGIDRDLMPRLFEKFTTKGGEEGGTGLGLFISKSIVEAHGGTIQAKNNENGTGAIFAFSLPCGN